MKEMTVKCVAVGILSLAGAYFEQLGGAIAVLGITMVLDYITGMVRAYLTSTLSSRRGMRGILKKLSYFIVIASGTVCDWILARALCGTQPPPLPYFASLLVTVWLMGNELISILENLGAIGVPLPAFLTRLIERLAVMVEKKGEEMIPEGAPSEQEASEQETSEQEASGQNQSGKENHYDEGN